MNSQSRNSGIILSGLFIFSAFAFAVFFSGFDKPYFAPALILIAGVFWVTLLPGFRRGWSFPSAPPAIALALFIWWLAFSLLWTQVPNVSMIFCMTISTMPLLFFSLTQSARGWDFVKAGRIALIAACSLMAVWAGFQFFFLSDLVGSRVHHPMLNPNNLAVTLVMAVFLLLPIFATGSRLAQIVSGSLMTLIVFAILTTQSRGGMLGMLLGFLAFGGLCLPVIRNRWKSFALLAGALVIAATVYFPIIAGRMTEGIHLIGGVDAAASTEGRFYLWKAGFNMFRDNPFIGTGLGTFYLIFPRYRETADLSDGFFLHVDPIQFGIETGLPATLLFYGFALMVLLFTIKALRVKDAGSRPRTEMVCGFAGLLGLLINSHLDFDLYMVPAQTMAAYLLSAWYLGGEEILGPSRLTLSLKKRPDRIFLVPALLIVLVAAPVWISFAGIAVWYDGKASEALSRDNPAEAAEYAGLALQWGPRNYDRAYYMDALWRGSILQKRFYTLDPDSRVEFFQKSMSRINECLRYNSYNIQASSTQALLYFTAYPRLDPDGLDHAREVLERAIKLDPVNFDLRMGLGKMYDLLNRTQDSVDVLEAGLRYELAQRYVPAQYYMLLSEGKRKLGQDKEADAFAQKAVERNQEALDASKTKFAFDLWYNQKIDSLLK